MKIRRIARSALLPMLALAVAACSSSEGEVETMPNDGAMATTTWTAQIEGMNQGHGGSAEARLAGGGTEVTVTLSRGTTGGTHPWHVHMGTCGSGGGIVGSPSAYPVLTPNENADAVGTANLAVTLDPNASYYINIHQSSDDMGTIVGCGNLTAS